MKKAKTRELNSFLVLIICVVIVSSLTYGLKIMKSNFEESHKVSAEVLPVLPEVIIQNQTSEIINYGYLAYR